MGADQPAAAFDYFLTVPYYQFATVERMITDVLDLDDTRYEPPTGRQGHRTDRPVLGRDGTLRRRGHAVELAREGLPTMDTIELPSGRDGSSGRFLLTASSRVRRPTREQLLVAVTLAEQVAGSAIRRDGEAADQR